MSSDPITQPGEAEGPSLDELVTVDVSGLSDEGLRVHTLALHRARDRVDASLNRSVDVFDRRVLWAGDEARSGQGWLAARVEDTRPECRREIVMARALRDMPATRQAFDGGRIGRAKVLALVDARTPDLADAFDDLEDLILAQVADLTVADAKGFLRGWQAMAREHLGIDDPDDDRPPPDAGKAPQAAVSVTATFDGRCVIDGEADAENGAILRSALDAEVDNMWNLGIFGSDDGLSAPERRGQALMQIVTRTSRPVTKHGAPRPSVEVVVDEATLLGEPIDDTDDLLRRCRRIVNGPTIGNATLQRLLCSADVHRIVIAATGEVLDVGIDVRLANRAQRRALRRRHGGFCAWPGCDAPFDWCEAHHIIPFDPDDPTSGTDMANLVPLCRFHHHRVHEGGYTLTLEPDGDLTVHGPGDPHDPNRRRCTITPARRHPPPVAPHPDTTLAKQRIRDLAATRC